jgi:hypothetical protein
MLKKLISGITPFAHSRFDSKIICFYYVFFIRVIPLMTGKNATRNIGRATERTNNLRIIIL